MMTPFKEVLVLLLFALPFSKSSSRYDGKAKLSSAVESTCRDWWPNRCKWERKNQLEIFGKNCGEKGSKTGFCCKTCNELYEKGLITDSKADGISLSEINLEKQLETCRKENLFNHQGAFSVPPKKPMQSHNIQQRNHPINLKSLDTRTKWKDLKPEKDGFVTLRV